MKYRNLFTLCLITICFCFNPLFAKKIDINKAKQVATNFYIEKFNACHHTVLKSVSIAETYLINENTETVFYIFNMSNGGFIMVSADDIVYPVLGYSFESTYNNNNLPPQFIYLINNYKKQITLDITARLSSTPQIDAEWERLNKTTGEFALTKNILSSSDTVGPLCTSTWSQGCCYNAQCPYDTTATSNCDHVVTGCVATAMAQEMYYYKYPLQGVGSHTDANINYGTLTVNFGATTYNWSAMTNNCPGTDSATATLMYHCGVAVNMNYGANGSSATILSAVNALKNYFGYTTVLSANKTSYTQAGWDTLIASELLAGRPVIYSGVDPTNGGQAWICDGYHYNNVIYYFHFNWGWSGAYDGYFLTSNPNPYVYSFKNYNTIIYNIYPSTVGITSQNLVLASVAIYPNPASYTITIESPQPAVIEILNIQGQLIKTLATTGNKTNIDVSALPSGVYVVEVKTEKGVEVKKFIKE